MDNKSKLDKFEVLYENNANTNLGAPKSYLTLTFDSPSGDQKQFEQSRFVNFIITEKLNSMNIGIDVVSLGAVYDEKKTEYNFDKTRHVFSLASELSNSQVKEVNEYLTNLEDKDIAKLRDNYSIYKVENRIKFSQQSEEPEFKEETFINQDELNSILAEAKKFGAKLTINNVLGEDDSIEVELNGIKKSYNVTYSDDTVALGKTGGRED